MMILRIARVVTKTGKKRLINIVIVQNSTPLLGYVRLVRAHRGKPHLFLSLAFDAFNWLCLTYASLTRNKAFLTGIGLIGRQTSPRSRTLSTLPSWKTPFISLARIWRFLTILIEIGERTTSFGLRTSSFFLSLRAYGVCVAISICLAYVTPYWQWVCPPQ